MRYSSIRCRQKNKAENKRTLKKLGARRSSGVSTKAKAKAPSVRGARPTVRARSRAAARPAIIMAARPAIRFAPAAKRAPSAVAARGPGIKRPAAAIGARSSTSAKARVASIASKAPSRPVQAKASKRDEKKVI
ncbi:MAG: hypothetical protein ABH860_02095 [bacterium]